MTSKNKPFKRNPKHDAEAAAIGAVIVGWGSIDHDRVYKLNCGHTQNIRILSVRNNKFRCLGCVRDELKKCASSVGLELITKEHLLRMEYRFISCGHRQFIVNQSVKTNIFTCSTCIKEKHKKEAEAVGLELIEQEVNGRRHVYRFNSCGHTQSIKNSNVRINIFRCSTCLNLRLKKEAEAVGAVIIGKCKNLSSRIYKFNSCGHEQSVTIMSIRINSFRCQKCYLDSLENDAKLAGLMLIDSTQKIKSYKLYRFINCGHDHYIQPYSVKIKSFVCHECNQTPRTMTSFVYLLKITNDNFTWLKLGYARSVVRRLNTYRLATGSEIEIIAVAKFDTGEEAQKIETSIHRSQEKHKLCTSKMKEYHGNGFSECYPLHMLDTIEAIILTAAIPEKRQ